MAATITTDTVEPLEARAEWTASEVADTSPWTLRLTADDVSELRAALATARSRRDDVLDVTAHDFPLPTLAPRLIALVADLVDGRGFCRISGLPVDDLGHEDASWIYWGIGRHLGEPWPQNVKGHLLGDVRDQGKRPDDPTARGNEIGGSASPSTPTAPTSWACSACTLACEGARASSPTRWAPTTASSAPGPIWPALYDPLPYDFRGEQADGARPFYEVPVFSRHGDRLFVRYIRPYIEASQRHPDAPRLTALQREAMDALDAIVADPEMQVEMRFDPGDMQFINNYHVLHGRRSYVDDPASGAVRFLKRLWLATSQLADDERPARFQRAGATSHWADKRTKA